MVMNDSVNYDRFEGKIRKKIGFQFENVHKIEKIRTPFFLECDLLTTSKPRTQNALVFVLCW